MGHVQGEQHTRGVFVCQAVCLSFVLVSSHSPCRRAESGQDLKARASQAAGIFHQAAVGRRGQVVEFVVRVKLVHPEQPCPLPRSIQV